jgi:xanthine/uracil permease
MLAGVKNCRNAAPKLCKIRGPAGRVDGVRGCAVGVLAYLCDMFNTLHTIPAPVLGALSAAMFAAVCFLVSFIQTRIQS